MTINEEKYCCPSIDFLTSLFHMIAPHVHHIAKHQLLAFNKNNSPNISRNWHNKKRLSLKLSSPLPYYKQYTSTCTTLLYNQLTYNPMSSSNNQFHEKSIRRVLLVFPLNNTTYNMYNKHKKHPNKEIVDYEKYTHTKVTRYKNGHSPNFL